MAKTELRNGNPARQSFYRVSLKSGDSVIAEWREYEKSEGKRWWTYISDDPTEEKVRAPLGGVVSYSTVDEAEVARFLKRAPTRDERIAAAYASYCHNNSIYPVVTRTAPPSRLLKVGQEVLVGRLHDAVVVGIFEDGGVVVIEHTEQKSRSVAKPFRTFGAWHWMAVLPKERPKVSDLAYTPTYSVQTYLSTPIGSLIRRVYSEGVKDNPDYQREYAWTPEDKNLYLETLFAGRPLGTFMFVKRSGGQADELLDGKQRMTTLLELVMSVIPYRGVYWHEMTENDRNVVMNRPAQFADLDDKQYSQADFYEIFLAVNAAGVPQTEEHLNFVRAKLAAARKAEAAAKQ
jgi:hypothetical protein